jgi:hypothetical protein
VKIRTHNTIENGKYRVTKLTEDFSEADVEGMEEFGEPEIDLGGSFGTDPVFELSTNLEKVKTGSPFTYRFDTRDHDLNQVNQISVAGSGDAPTLGGKYFDLTTTSSNYRVWFDENNTSTPPADGGRTLVEVDLPLAGTTTDTAAALVSALDALPDLSAAPGDLALDVLATDAGYGPVVDAVHGTTVDGELVLTTPVQGDSAQYRAEAWDTEISARITAAILELRQLMDTFSGETVENV